MRIINVNRFDGGIADDYLNGGIGEFSISKQFDILSYPRRLQPLRGMTADTTGTKIGNIIVSNSDGLMYGIGTDSGNPTLGALYKRSGYGGSDTWSDLAGHSGFGVVYPFLVEYPDQTDGRTILWASTGKIVETNPSTGNLNTDALSFTNIGQGLQHPKDKLVYIPYDSKIGKYSGNSLSTGILTLPTQYRIYCLSHFENYLAIPATTIYSNKSILGLWDRDTSNTLLNESVQWNGNLQVLNNLNGTLVGISSVSPSNYNSETQDSDAIQIRIWNGGASSTLIDELKIEHNGSDSGHPSAVINPNVNFIFKDRLYFSINLIAASSTPANPSYYGLWSVGLNKFGHWAVVLERVATNSNTETGVLAAAISGDFVSMAHTAVGTLTCTNSVATGSSSYTATSVYESLVNQDMPEVDKPLTKQLGIAYARFQPLLSGQQVVMKYRVDTDKSGSFTTIVTYSTVGGVYFEMPNANGTEFTAGRNYEFRLESTGGAIITEWGYGYETLELNR